MEERLSAAGGELLADIRAGVATVTLNRPAALNALSFGMLEGLGGWLDAWEHDDRVRHIVFRGVGGRAFCAGGDVRALYERLVARDPDVLEYFIVEYALDHRIHTYPKTIMADLDGIVMGGGMGISQGAGVRIAGPRTKMAMPETVIGLFPDVGGSYFLSRVPGHVGTYLGLAGPTINAADAVYCGLADFATRDTEAPGELPALREAIDRHFGHANMMAIVESLRSEKDPRFAAWATSTVEALRKRSPMLLAVTLEQLRRGARMPLADCLRMELGLIAACFEQRDIVEGIRALLVDKDNAPRWNPARLQDVRDADVERFFAPRWPRSGHPLAMLG